MMIGELMMMAVAVVWIGTVVAALYEPKLIEIL